MSDDTTEKIYKTVACDNCGDTVELTYSTHSEHTYHFCDFDCRGEWHSQKYSGANHQNHKPSIYRKCWWCASELERKPSRDVERWFCDGSCHGNWKSWNNVHPQDPTPDYDVPKWFFDEHHSQVPREQLRQYWQDQQKKIDKEEDQ